MHFVILRLSENVDKRRMELDSSTVKIRGEEHCDLISLKILFIAVEFFVIFEHVYIKLKTAFRIMLVKNCEKLFKDISICYFNCKEHEYFDFSQDV